jgi:hypothetical protein
MPFTEEIYNEAFNDELEKMSGLNFEKTAVTRQWAYKKMLSYMKKGAPPGLRKNITRTGLQETKHVPKTHLGDVGRGETGVAIDALRTMQPKGKKIIKPVVRSMRAGAYETARFGPGQRPVK